jgi:diadenylate cyclase
MDFGMDRYFARLTSNLDEEQGMDVFFKFDQLHPFLSVLRDMFSWQAGLDILLITFGLFFLCRTLLRLGTWKIVTGILIAVAIFIVAHILDLRGIEWIYSNVSHVALIALIVIFQPELRKVLERAASLRRNELTDDSFQLAILCADALSSLAQQRRGAILVFPGREPIREWLSGGFVLNAVPSFPLLMSIFDPNSPGHDGALVIERGRLTRFGVRLPVSKSQRLSEEYGTRHHAAMGLAEVSDALILVVSEERGSVIRFHSGQARMLQNKKEVAEEILLHWEDITTYLGIPASRQRWDLVVQIAASFVVASIFWSALTFARGGMLERVVTVPVEYVATPEQLALVGEKSNEVKLHLAGTKSDFDGLNFSSLNVTIDLSRAVAGKQTFTVTSDNVGLPKGIRLLDVQPSALTLVLASIVEQDMPIKAQLIGKLPPGLKLQAVDVSPQKVRVLIPADDRQKKEMTITTTPIYLETIREDIRLFCKVIAPPNIQPVAKRWPDVEVLIAVVPSK